MSSMKTDAFHAVEIQVEKKIPAAKPKQLLGVRHLQIFLMFLCIVVAYALRVNFSVAIVAMISKEGTGVGFPEYDWVSVKGILLSSFFWGNVATQIPAGQLAQRFGPKIVLSGAVFTASLFTVLTPLSASVGDWGLVCACRVAQGLGQGFIFPSVHTLLSSWTPMEERGRLGTYVYAGIQLGMVITLPVSGVLASSVLGWPSIFYIFGGGGICCALLWHLLGADSPSSHRFISPQEKCYIEDNLGFTQSKDMKRRTPWLSFFTSLPMWALIIAHCTQNWGFYTLLTEMPSFMKEILNYDINSNGLLSALPYLVMWLMSFVFSWASDFLNSRQMISLGASRKIFNTIGHWIPGVALVALAYSSKEDSTLPVALLTLAVGINSAYSLGFQLNHIDLSPNYAGTMMGITNCIANFMGILAPLLVGAIVTEHDDEDVLEGQWRIVFFTSSGIYFAGNFIFVLFGKAEIQSWNEPPQTERKDLQGSDNATMKYTEAEEKY